jgi:hypothetical protein
MRCESFLDRYDLLDAGEEPGILLRLHLARCPRCQEKVLAVNGALAAYREESAAPGFDEEGGSMREGAFFAVEEDERVDERIMAAVRLLPKPRREANVRDWAIAGGLIVASMALIPFDQSISSIKEIFGTSYALPLSLVLGIALTVYAAVFIATHMDDLEPIVRRHMPRV